MIDTWLCSSLVAPLGGQWLIIDQHNQIRLDERVQTSETRTERPTYEEANCSSNTIHKDDMSLDPDRVMIDH